MSNSPKSPVLSSSSESLYSLTSLIQKSPESNSSASPKMPNSFENEKMKNGDSSLRLQRPDAPKSPKPHDTPKSTISDNRSDNGDENLESVGIDQLLGSDPLKPFTKTNESLWLEEDEFEKNDDFQKNEQKFSNGNSTISASKIFDKSNKNSNASSDGPRSRNNQRTQEFAEAAGAGGGHKVNKDYRSRKSTQQLYYQESPHFNSRNYDHFGFEDYDETTKASSGKNSSGKKDNYVNNIRDTILPSPSNADREISNNRNTTYYSLESPKSKSNHKTEYDKKRELEEWKNRSETNIEMLVTGWEGERIMERRSEIGMNVAGLVGFFLAFAIDPILSEMSFYYQPLANLYMLVLAIAWSAGCSSLLLLTFVSVKLQRMLSRSDRRFGTSDIDVELLEKRFGPDPSYLTAKLNERRMVRLDKKGGGEGGSIIAPITKDLKGIGTGIMKSFALNTGLEKEKFKPKDAWARAAQKMKTVTALRKMGVKHAESYYEYDALGYNYVAKLLWLIRYGYINDEISKTWGRFGPTMVSMVCVFFDHFGCFMWWIGSKVWILVTAIHNFLCQNIAIYELGFKLLEKRIKSVIEKVKTNEQIINLLTKIRSAASSVTDSARKRMKAVEKFGKRKRTVSLKEPEEEIDENKNLDENQNNNIDDVTSTNKNVDEFQKTNPTKPVTRAATQSEKSLTDTRVLEERKKRKFCSLPNSVAAFGTSNVLSPSSSVAAAKRNEQSLTNSMSLSQLDSTRSLSSSTSDSIGAPLTAKDDSKRLSVLDPTQSLVKTSSIKRGSLQVSDEFARAKSAIAKQETKMLDDSEKPAKEKSNKIRFYAMEWYHGDSIVADKTGKVPLAGHTLFQYGMHMFLLMLMMFPFATACKVLDNYHTQLEAFYDDPIFNCPIVVPVIVTMLFFPIYFIHQLDRAGAMDI